MNNVWLVSDTHFGHANACVFRNSDGTKMRPCDDVNEMDEAMVDNWNRVVKPGDRVYHLDDVAINRRHLPTIAVEWRL
jgi:calcineurin-like phosphoesterase family protein